MFCSSVSAGETNEELQVDVTLAYDVQPLVRFTCRSSFSFSKYFSTCSVAAAPDVTMYSNSLRRAVSNVMLDIITKIRLTFTF